MKKRNWNNWDRDIRKHIVDNIIAEILTTLPEDVADILEMRMFKKMTYKSIGEKIGLTNVRVRQLAIRGIRAYHCRLKIIGGELSRFKTFDYLGPF